MKALLLDQFCGVTPYALQQEPIKFETLVEEQLARNDPNDWNPAQVVEIGPDYRPPNATQVYVRGEDGNAEWWGGRLDSSG